MLFNKVRNFKNEKIDGTTTAAEQTDYLVLYLLDALRRDVDGDVVEFGCYIGETSKYLKKCLLEWHSTKKLWVYDSFEGLPPLGEHEKGTGWTEGGFKTNEDILINNFLTNGLEPPKIVKGWFKEVTDIPEKVCFAFLDGDFYESIYDSLEKVYDRVSDGGYIFFHDYERPDLPGVKAAIDDFLTNHGENKSVLKICNQLAVIKKGPVSSVNCPILTIPRANLTVVTGLWNIGRDERHFENHYLHHLKQLLEAPCNLFIYIEAKYEHIIWEIRSRENTYVKVYELDDVRQLYSPFWDRTQKIRNDPKWQNITGEDGWLKGSPQARLEYYNPVVQSKMFMMHDVTIWNPFDTKYFMWVDAGLTNTVTHGLNNETFYTNVTKYMDPFLFLSFDYDPKTNEVHGMKREHVNKYAGEEMGFVCRGGLFGGSKLAIHYAHASYYGLLDASLNDGVMGTEETLFAIMSCLRPNYFRRFELPGTIITPFLDAVISSNVPVTGQNLLNKEYHEIRDRTAIYFLTFNKPDQLEMTLKHLYKWNADWGNVIHKYVIDNTPDGEIRAQNKKVCDAYGFVHIPMMKNIGINGGRQYVAEHFDALDIDYYVFFEDDMTLNGDDLKNEYCRNGFRRYVPDLWNTMHGIMAKESLDFLKLTFQEVFMDNQEQVSWYNVNNEVRSSVWPYYHKLPVTGFDPNCPRTEYDYIDVFNGTAYAVGQPYYCNWPLLFSKAGNKKVFLDVKFEHPHERTQMAYVFERQHRGEIKAAVLLASTITHDRQFTYEAADRKEG